ncbi:response regulator transcription factor [Dyella sp.]|jgi:DNA-binding response OmpR family regulator|uniref:response regulator transcription factor n=1 Tax=Dyella sp. TaxID=1869338 RepID=UPI002D77B48C|nr:response regulator transcription factor [Dyella sp.]HET6432796.1 response regulator transcription factor [Dyella sp.]
MTNPTPPVPVQAAAHLLVVDDDEEVGALLQRYFGAQGFRVTVVGDGASMHERLASESVQLVLLDLGLPGEDGFELTRHLHEHWRGPVIIITGRGESVDRVVGLELGADDYVTKPFDLRELLARVRSVLRRAADQGRPEVISPPRHYHFAGYRLDPKSRHLTSPEGETVALTSGEYELLSVLLEHPHRVLSRDDLMTRIHGRDAGPYDRAIDVQIGRLRRKIEPNPTHPILIKAVRGVGYLFAEPVQRE